MRSTNFDMLGMTLMALAIVLTTGVGTTWAYLREKRSGPQTSPHQKRPAVPAAASSEEKAPAAVHR